MEVGLECQDVGFGEENERHKSLRSDTASIVEIYLYQ
jgi:hypothetical protein